MEVSRPKTVAKTDGHKVKLVETMEFATLAPNVLVMTRIVEQDGSHHADRGLVFNGEIWVTEFGTQAYWEPTHWRYVADWHI